MSEFSHGEMLVSMFARLEQVEPLIRIILSGARLSVSLTFRGDPERRILLDFRPDPLKIVVDDLPEPGEIEVAIRAELMHEVLLGRMHPGEALGRRELLLRGSSAKLAKFIPLFDFAPLLYREHLISLGAHEHLGSAAPKAGPERRTENGGFMQVSKHLQKLRQSSEKTVVKLVHEAAYAAGYGMGMLRHRFLLNMNLFDVLAAMSKGVEAATPEEDEAS
jgi:hypothetical protein